MTGPKRVSERQLAANRANARRSTGPRTPEGRAVSAQNAIQHGILSQAVIPPTLERFESREEYDALLASFVESLAPEGPVEEMLVERIATSYWRLARLLRAEAAAIANRRDQADAPSYERYKKNQRKACLLRDNLAKLDEDPKARKRLYNLFDEQYGHHPKDDELASAVAEWLPDLEYELPEPFQRGELAWQVACSLPENKDLPLLMRYEAAIDRSIHRALGSLERLQRLRRGEFVPPAVRVEVEG